MSCRISGLIWLGLAMFFLTAGSLAQSYYRVGGVVRFEDGTDMGTVATRPTVTLDGSRIAAVSYMGGGCNYSFDSVSAGQHAIVIRCPATATLEAEINVDHQANCTTGSSTYDFTLHPPLITNGLELHVPTAVGTVWRYAYQNSWFNTGISGGANGTHTWTVLSSDAAGGVTTVQVADVRDDSVWSLYGGGIRRKDTLYFPIVITPDSVRITCSEIAAAFQGIPRWCRRDADSVEYYRLDGANAVYRDRVGLTRFNSGASGGHNFNLTSVQLIDFTPGVPSAVLAREPAVPRTLELEQNYPNPFNPATTIRFAVPQRGDVDLGLYDVTGRLVRSLLRAAVDAGTYTVNIDAGTISSGVYLCRLQQGEAVATRRLVLIR